MKKFLHSIGRVAKGHRLASKLLSVLLTLLLIFYVVPPIIYTKAAEAIGKEDADAAITEGVDKVASPNPYLYESTSYEVTELREESVKHFRLEDGSYLAAQYPVPVHYYENGELVDIDNSLSSVSGGFYATENARIKFVKKTGGSGEIFKLQDGSTKLTVSLVDALKKTAGEIIEDEGEEGLTELQKMTSLENLTSRIIYRDILEGVDLEYVLESLNVKENIIVKERSEEYTYRFTLALNGLTAAFGDEGDILVFEGESIKYTIPAPTVFDSLGVCAPITEAWYTLVDLGGGKYSMAVTVTNEWMNSPDRAFPVTVDPTINHPDTLVTDTYIYSCEPDEISYYPQYLLVSESYQSYWKTSSLPTIPVSAYINNASLYLLCPELNNYPYNVVAAHKVTTDWDSSLTYNRYLNGEGAIDSTILDYNSPAFIDYEPRYMQFNITSAVKEWYSGSENYGIALKSMDDYSQSISFFSSDYHMYTPYFTVSYVNLMGLEDYWSYETQSVGFAGTSSINMATGNMVLTIPTLTTTDSILPFTPTLVYNSSLAGKEYSSANTLSAYSASYMPYGFKLNINETIVSKDTYDENGEAYTLYIFADADGTEHAFYPSLDDENTYYDEDGLNLKLTLDSSTNTISITDDSKTVKTFSSKAVPNTDELTGAWYLTSISDANGNSIVFTFDDALHPIRISLLPFGNPDPIVMLKLFYSNSNLTRIFNPSSGRAVVFRYSREYNSDTLSQAGKYLRQIDYAYGIDASESEWIRFQARGLIPSSITNYATAKYEYTSDGLITKLEDCKADQYISYTYQAGKVTSIKQYAGETGKLGYSASCYYQTDHGKIMTPGADGELYTVDDHVKIYVFDKYGRAQSVHTYLKGKAEIISAVTLRYSTDTTSKNKIIETSVAGNYSANYILNGDFEETNSSTVFDYWSLTGEARKTINNVFSGEGEYCLNLRPSYGSSAATATQQMYLYCGEYNLSFQYNATYCEHTTLSISVQSLTGTQVYASESISLHKAMSSSTISDFSTTFSIKLRNANGDQVKLVISAVTGSAVEVVPNIKIDRIMLRRGDVSSEFNLVSYGTGAANVINSAGNTVPCETYWEANGSVTFNSIPYGDFKNAIKLEGGMSGDITSIGNYNYIKQRIYEAPASLIYAYDDEPSSFFTNARFDYMVGGFAYAEQASHAPIAIFRIRVDVVYYQGEGREDVIKSYTFNFLPEATRWQYTGGIFSTEYTPSSTDTGAYSCVKAIDIYCEYSNQFHGEAYFTDISVVGVRNNNVAKYDYYKDGENAGLVQVKRNFFYNEYYEYDNERRLTRVANSRGQLTDYFYSENNLIGIVQYDFKHINNPNNLNYPHNATDSDGNPISPDSLITKTLRSTTEYEYNEYGQIIRITNTGGNTVMVEEYVYDTDWASKNFGALIEKTDTTGQCTSYYYDESTGQLLAVIDKAMETGIIYNYGEDGSLQAVREVVYDAETDEYYAVSNGRTIEYSENAYGLVDEITTGTTAYSWSFDVFGNPTSVIIGYDVIAEYEYYPRNGLLKKIVYANGDTEDYEYNTLELLEKVWYTKSSGTRTLTYEYEYTGTGQIAREINHESERVTAYTYDASGRIISIREYDMDAYLDEVWLKAGYDDLGNLSIQSYYISHQSNMSLDGTTSVVYQCFFDESRKLEERIVDTHAIVGSESYSYDVMDRLINKSLGYSIDDDDFSSTVEYTYYLGEESTGNVRTYTTTIGDNDSLTYTYTYDMSGRITKIEYSTGEEIRYYYDNLGQLIREDNEPLDRTFIYEYDNGGNLTRKEVCYLAEENVTPIGIGDYTYQYESMTDRLILFDEAITYDEYGNPLTYPFSRTFSWNGTKLVSATDDGKTINFYYNGSGELAEKTVNGVATKYSRIGGQLITERISSGTIIYLYDPDGSPIGFQYISATAAVGDYKVYLYEKNLLGDIIAVYDSAGTKLVSYLYDAWGYTYVTYHNGASASHTAAKNPFRYRGYYYDADLDLYYLGSRYYDPFASRFISPDSIEYLGASGDFGSYNLYAYCGNDPVNFVDPSGHSAIALLITFGIGAVLGGIYGGISAVANGQDVLAGIAIGFVVGGLTGIITEAFSVPWVLLGTFVVGAGGDVASQRILDGKSWGEVNLVSAAWAGVTNAGLSLVGKGLPDIYSMNDLKVTSKIIFGTMTNSPLIGLGMAINMGISKHASVYTYNDLKTDIMIQLGSINN